MLPGWDLVVEPLVPFLEELVDVDGLVVPGGQAQQHHAGNRLSRAMRERARDFRLAVFRARRTSSGTSCRRWRPRPGLPLVSRAS